MALFAILFLQSMRDVCNRLPTDHGSLPVSPNNLIKGLLGADQTEFATGAFLDSRRASLQIPDFRIEGEVTLPEGFVLLELGLYGLLHAPRGDKATLAKP